MKRLATAIIALLALTALIAPGCSNQSLLGVSPEEAVNSCVTCHTDKDTLRELATVEEHVMSAETTG